MKRLLCLILTVLMCLTASAASCTDALGNELTFDTAPERVVSLFGSYGVLWLEAGGTLAGATSDLMDDPRIGEAADLGSHTEPSMELLYTLDPDLVILAADTAEHRDIGAALTDAGIPVMYLSVMTYTDYMDTMAVCTALTGHPELMDTATVNVRTPIEETVAAAQALPGYGEHTCLLLRAFSTSVRAKGSASTVAGPVLSDMGFVNIADSDSALTDNLTLEAVIAADPDYIFMVPMGSDPAAAEASMEAMLTGNPAWASLSAVRNGRYIVLDKELFHQRPNGRWAEAYSFLLDLLTA